MDRGEYIKILLRKEKYENDQKRDIKEHQRTSEGRMQEV